MAITRTPIHDDDGSGTTGTIIDNAWKQELYNQIDASSGGTDYSATAIGGVIASAVASALHVVFLNHTAAPITVTGFTAPNVKGGDRLLFVNAGTQIALFQYGAGPPLFFNAAASAPTPILPKGWIAYTARSDGLWCLTGHEQGGWINFPYTSAQNSAIFGTTNGSWGVDTADVLTLAYRLDGNTLTVAYAIASSSIIAAAPTAVITNVAWGGFTIGGISVQQAIAWAVEGGVVIPSYAQAAANGTYIGFFKSAGGNWVASTNTTYIYGQITFPVA